MSKQPDMIAHLNAALRNQLTCINQCFLHARMLKYQGQLKLADTEYKESIDSMKYSDMLVERILSLGGLPNLQELGQLMVGETLEKMLTCDLALKEHTLKQLLEAVAFSEASGDKASAQLLGKILASIDEHIGYLREQCAQLVDAA